MKDFFISYNKANRAWAEWIAWTLEKAGHSVVIQAWDFRPGENFAFKMQDAAKDTQKTIAVLSEAYMAALFTQAEWAAAFARDPRGQHRTLIPVRVEECEPEGILGPTIYIDVVGRSEEDARQELLDGINRDRAKPATAPAFPSDRQETSPISEPTFRNPVDYPGRRAFYQGRFTNAPTSNLPTGIPFFTGREDVFKRLEAALKATGSTALAQRQALSGLGGIGKTQTALEYASRHQCEYKALLWAVAESKESLISDFVAIAHVLKLPEVNAPDQTFVVTAVRRWLEINGDWLLILDNADDPLLLEDFLPDNLGGHLLLTSRAQIFDAVGILNPIELEEMAPDDAQAFLLRRTGRGKLSDDESQAMTELAKELDYLPLALEQAGAYIKELRSGFHDYLASYHQRGLELLEKGHPTGKYRKSVRTTWSLNFQQVEQSSIASADVLRVSAFLNPDRIPIELLTEGAGKLGRELSSALSNVNTDPLILDELLRPLIQYSLIRRDRSSKTYDIHRLVQAVLKDGMEELGGVEWAQRVVGALAHVFPDVDLVNVSDWDRIERLLPHALVCAELVTRWNLESPETAHLLNLTGRYLHTRGRLRETVPLYNEALRIRENVLGQSDPAVSTSLRNQGWLCHDQGKYSEAESLCLRSLAVVEEARGLFHPDVAATLIILGRAYLEQGRFIEARRTVSRSLEIRMKELGSDSLETAESFSCLADIEVKAGRYQECEIFAQRALEIREKSSEPPHEIANELGSLAFVRRRQRRYGEAETLLLRAIGIIERTFGSSFPRLATCLIELARLRIDETKFDEAESLLSRSLEIVEKGLGMEHPETAGCCMMLGQLYRRQSKYLQAEKFHHRALATIEKTFGNDNPRFAIGLTDLAYLYLDQKKYSRGEPIIRRAIPILRDAFGLENESVSNAMTIHAALLKGLNRKGEAQKLEAQARKIQAKLNKKRPK